MPQLLVDEYIELTNEYRKKYGEKTIIWMQTGSFYEVYAWNEEDEQIKVSQNILQIRITTKKSGNNKSCLMAGFPDHSYKRFEKRLLKENYTIVYVDQIKKDPIERGVTKISSPGCVFDSDDDSKESILMSVLIEIEDNDFYGYYTIYDSNIGEIRMLSIKNEENQTIDHIFDNIGDIISENRVNEVLLNIVSEQYIKLPETNSKILFHYNKIDKIDELLKPLLQNDILSKYFKKYLSIYENVIDSLELSKCLPQEIVNLIYMLDFLKDHEPIFVKNLQRPIVDGPNQIKYMEFYNHALQKLQVISNEGNDLIKFIDKTLTYGGSKKLKYLLKNPSNNIEELKKRYKSVDLFVNNRQLLNETKTYLKICDLHRFYRRFAIGKINVYNDIPRIVNINENINILINIFKNVDNSIYWLPNDKIIQNFKDYCGDLIYTFCIDNCKSSGNVFNKDIVPELDDLYLKSESLNQELESIRTYLCDLINEPIYLKNTDKDGFFFETTKKRGTKIAKQLKENNKFDLEISNSTSVSKISSDGVKKISVQLCDLQTKIIDLTQKKVSEKVLFYYDTYFESSIATIIESMAWLDVYYSYSKSAIEWNYVKPNLVECENSYIDAKQLRHPIIEQLLSIEKQAFIPNDIRIGFKESYLLYGVNSVGKSSLLKSVGLSVIMAQSGMFVPASDYKLCPYDKLIVRIGNTDNLFEAHSSFICEIREANQCVSNTNNRSLVLADEFCASTERESATQIVTSMLLWLNEKKSSFIFATHLFELIEAPIVNVKICHLKVRIESDSLVFDRKLTSGPPTERNYGILVAKKIFKNNKFLKMMDRCQTKTSTRTDINRSRYNRSVLLSECAICAYSPTNEMSLPLDTHHINMQCMANSDGFIGNYHKDIVSNLVVLCKKCHIMAHNGKLNIKCWEQRDCGNVLNYEIK
uniref:DNA mismatch repair proteins mutS family domain-containing protein n=1 Tax=viral metagenome TaxID=1070528 RepID=A0A6C0AHB3_9ZZZZ|tara:strand:+ start:2327 stop:5107 length:2781 start_codon:yes stop_codon:yes gene_type:complete